MSAPGPRGWKLTISDHALQRWQERCAHVDTPIEHCLRFARIVGPFQQPRRQHGRYRGWGLYAALIYRPEMLLFIARKDGPVWQVVTILNSLYTPGAFPGDPDLSLYAQFHHDWREKPRTKVRATTPRRSGKYSEHQMKIC